MTASPNDSASSHPRALKMRMRPDLIVAEHRYGGEPYWVIKDPVGLNFYHLNEQEFAILSSLDGRSRGVEEIKRRFNQQFAPRQLSTNHLQAFLTRMNRNGLLLVEADGQATPLLERQSKKRRQEWISSLTNVLAIRFRGFDPDRLLDRIAPWTNWAFSRGALAGVGLFVFAALALVLFRFQEFQDRLPEIDSYLTPSNLLGLAIVMGAIKVIHELGHALACKRFGGECHEMGVMLLVFTPCLYCNVSDAWMLRSRWQRIAISAAGIAVEAALAAVCTFLWWFSQSGALNSIFFNVMLVASVGTVVLNGNPLMRYDGYFILSDLVEIPNLAQQSQAALSSRIKRIFFGPSQSVDPSLPNRRIGFLISYAIASAVYRVFLLVTILWFVHRTLAAYHLESLAVVLALIVIFGLARGPITRLVRRLRSPLRQPIRKARTALTVMILLAACAAIAMIPVPTYITAPVTLEYADADRVYVSVEGSLIDSIETGQAVEQGAELAQLENLSVRLQTAKLEAERKQQALLLEHLVARRSDDRSASAEIPAARAALADLERRLEQLTRDEARLTLVATRAGNVLAPPLRPKDSPRSALLPHWSGVPLAPENENCFLETGTVFCLVGDPSALEAVLLIDESQIAQVAVGQKVRLRLNQIPHRVLTGTVSQIARDEAGLSGRDKEDDGRQGNGHEANSEEGPPGAIYLAQVELLDAPSHLRVGTEGSARVETAKRTLWWQVARYLARTFQFEI